MVAAVCGWHEDHASTASEINRRLARGDRLVSAAPALVEAYAVLTRLPAPHRLSPSDALSVLEANFMEGVRVVSLTPELYLRLLRQAPGAGISGGLAYDAVIAACALRDKASALLTLNAQHFRRWESPGLKVVDPRHKPA